MRSGRFKTVLATLLAVTCGVAACSGSGDDDAGPGQPAATTSPSSPPASDGGTVAPTATAAPSSSTPSGVDTEPPTLPDEADELRIDLDAAATPIDPRLFGVNIPAWAGPERLGDPAFRQATVESGATVVRMPGGSWSSSYSWLACEQGDPDGCFWTWAARPSDYAGFLVATGVEGMWTVSFNGTPQEAAALVAFFNGTVGDQRVIGTDRNGFDWGTVGQWAQLRADGGHVDPVPVMMWEIGNEVYGAKADAQGDCADFGWEDVWTCDGEQYIEGDDEHDGYVAFHQAMKAVDPSISIGAVGVPDPASWSNFGNKVMQAAAGLYDFYVVHDYGFQTSAPPAQVLGRPIDGWPGVVEAVADGLLSHEPERDVAVAVTEYNLVAFQDGDGQQQMDRALNALYIADLLGQMASTGVQIANVWNLVNGKAPNGTDYGLLDADTGERNPAFYGFASWQRIGDELLPVASSYDRASELSAYAARSDDGSVQLIVINKTGDAIDAAVTVQAASGPSFDWSVRSASATALDDDTMTMADQPRIATATSSATVSVPAFSITRIQLTPAG